MIGTTLSHYRIVEQIGAGGMGVVYRAHDESLDRDVAIKVLPAQVASDADRLARFQREAKAVAKLAHPNILEIWDFGTEDGITYAVTELLEGDNLRQRIPSGGMSWQRIIEIGAAVADGLAAAHGKGIVHRDLKPENIFVTSDGRVKILDFGLAQVKEPVSEEADTATLTPAGTVPGTVMGTVGYMSPEQLRGEPAGSRSDIFALGCVLYEMLVGQPAFLRGSTAETTAAILERDLPSFAASKIDLPTELERTIRRCVEKSPEARFQSASDLAYNLRSITTDYAVPMAKPSHGRKALWASAATSMIVIGAIAAVLGPGLFDRPAPMDEDQPIRSIALLPLQNRTGDPEQIYFVDGLHEELIATFAQISAFEKVIARASVMGFRDSDTPVRVIGERLGVDAVLEGSVRKGGNTVRVTLQLIDARSEEHLWSDSFDRNLADILALQSDVARTVAGKVRVALTPEEQTQMATTRTVDNEAYEAYLKGAHYLRSGLTEGNLTKAIAFFELAIEKDPTYAPAYASLAKALRNLTVRYRPPVEVMPRARRETLRALELDENLVEAHAQLAQIKAQWEWDWTGAEAEYLRALELGPNDVNALGQYASYLVAVGRLDEAIAMQQRAVQLDPVSPRPLRLLGWVYAYARRYDDAIEHLLKTIELHPGDYLAHFYLAWNYGGKGLHTEALAALEEARRHHPAPDDDPFFLAVLAYIQGDAGKSKGAAETLQHLLDLRKQTYVPPWLVAVAYAAIGDSDRAIEWLERAYETRDAHLPASKTNPALDLLRDDPRFRDILRRMNFPED